ncbi:LysR family transcriptional regulator [Sodalis ligni]|uniref:LysR family transcriptional regulator n=1 Tax=Sodalis ligni TaxID=2697027 RepID=UPI001BDF5462|nr:LysR family transcriptional regulator [Sodalis ligni]QWA11943.1 LysR family transcriptional regulator [Sodalis ligni]
MILLSKTLRYFIVTAQEQSIRMAALILCITPSPLCRTIKIFELNLGHKLFTRTNNGLKLTNYGRDLYATLLPLYQEICEIEKKVIKKTHQIQSGKSSLKIGLDHRDYSYLSPFLSSPVFKDTKTISHWNILLLMRQILETFLIKVCVRYFYPEKIQCPPGLLHQALSTDIIMLAVKSDLKTEDYSQNELL